MKNHLVVLSLVLIFLVGLGIGFYLGVESTIKEVVKVVHMFSNISIDYEAVNDALFSYKSNIANCFGGKI